MKKKVKKLWLEALRSGEYEQAKGELKQSDRFCCLGVLCDLYRQSHSDCEWDGIDDGVIMINGKRECYILPDEVMRWAKINDPAPHLWNYYNSASGKEACDTLATINDAGADFDLIAAIIEHEL